jgi:SAM-dependent methyltransferase
MAGKHSYDGRRFGDQALKSKLLSKIRASQSPMLLGARRRVRSFIKRDSWIPVGSVRWGDFRRQQPICANFGYGRGSPVDRHYIETFIGEHSNDVAGRVLEIKDAGYTRRFGGDRVEQSDVLDVDPANSAATIIGDLSDPKVLAEGVYDCVIVTQTLQYLFEPMNALRNLHRSLKPGGVLLLTVPGITPVRHSGADWYWSFTDASIERLLQGSFPSSGTRVRPCGNLVGVLAFLQGLSASELKETELQSCDEAYQLIIVARAVKAG